jgi:5-hydroxyisourate hydrolase
MSGGLSTHVLDTTHGRPAAGVAISLSHGENTLFEGVTNEDGRVPGMLGDHVLAVGPYRLVFAVADYFRAQGVVLPEPPFLDRVTIDFAVSDAEAHHHVPLLVSPFGYSTYRGS